MRRRSVTLSSFSLSMTPLTYLDIDLLRFLFTAFRQANVQNPVFEFCADLRLIDRAGNRERAQKSASRSFAAMLLRLGNRPRSLDDQATVVDVDFERLAIDSRQIHRDRIT